MKQRDNEITYKDRKSKANKDLVEESDNDDYLNFKAKTEEEVIKVPKCTYANDVKTQTTFYFCQCSQEDFYPICEACALKCHKSHSPALKLEGNYTCQCGKGNHVITRDNERRIKEKWSNKQKQCFFSKFMEITPNRGFYALGDNVFCSVCVEYCLSKKFTDADLEVCEEVNATCECEKHYEMNAINLNVDLISKPKFHLNLQNFNFNILYKIQISKQMYIDYFVKTIHDYNSSQTEEAASKTFFVNFINRKFLELFSVFATRWENKFFHVKGYLDEFKKEETLFKLMAFNEPVSMLTASEAPDFATAKIYFAEYIFNYITRTYQLKFNNLWNIRTILNMNLYQRNIYLQQIRSFFKFTFFNADYSKSYDQSKSDENIFFEMSSIFLDLYENILKVNENFDFTERILTCIFPSFNRIFKYLIKYNIINDEQKAKYFELVNDTINLANDNEECEFKGFSFYIIKSILYTLIYRNDRVCINYIRKEKDQSNKNFVFVNNSESDQLCKIFINVINKFNRNEDLNRTIIYDFYVRKIFELMIGKNEFYMKNLKNLTTTCVSLQEVEQISSFDLHFEMKNILDENYLKEIANFTNKLNMVNRDYFDYNIKYEDYLNGVNEIMKNLKCSIFDELNFPPDLGKKYQIFQERNTLDDMTNKVEDFQKCVKYTVFFQKMEEFLHIYAEGKTYYDPNKSKSFSEIGKQSEYLKMTIHFLFMVVNKNYENLCLLMNFKPKIFVNSYFEVQDSLFDFLDLIAEMLFTKQNTYEFDNFYFFTECLNEILIKLNFDTKEVVINNFTILDRVMKLAKKTIPHISMTQPDPLNCVESIIDKIRMIKQEQKYNQVLDDYFFNKENDYANRPEDQPLAVVEKFISSYFNFCNELIFHNLYFFGLIRDSDFIYELSSVEYIITQINVESNSKFNIPIEIEISMTRFCFLLNYSFNLNITDIERSVDNMFMKDIPKSIKNISLLHLSRSDSSNNSQNLSETEQLILKTTHLLNLLKKFENKFQKISVRFIKLERLLERKIFLLKFLEHCVVRPMFIIFNHFLLHSNSLTGNRCNVLFELTFYFLKSLAYFYENVDKNLDKASFENSIVNEDLRNSSSRRYEAAISNIEEDKRLLKKIEIFDYEEICVRSEIDLDIVHKIYEDSQEFSNNVIKYFDIENIHKLYVKNLEKIWKVTKEEKEEIIDMRNSKGGVIESGLTIMYSSFKTSTSTTKKSNELLRLEKLIEKYQDKLKITYDDNLSMIKVLESSDSDEEGELGVELFNYILSKFSDDLTDYNFLTQTKNNSYQPGVISNLDINKFKFQNVYMLIYLNALFYNDSGRFQQILEENIGDNYEIFFNFLTKNLIMPSVLCELRRVYELDYFKLERRGSNSTLGCEISVIAIKFLQNICESHNQVFQNKFFDFCYKLEPKEYQFKDHFKFWAELRSTRTFNSKRMTIPFLANDSSRKDIMKFDSDKKTRTEPEPKDANMLASSILRKTRLFTRPLVQGGEVERGHAGQIELIEKKKQREKEEAERLEKKKVSFLNFVCHHMRILFTHLHVDNEFHSSLLRSNRELKDYGDILEIYQRFSDLVVEMIQGTSSKNFDNFYKKLPDALNAFDETGRISNANTLESFVFLQMSLEIKSFLFDAKNTFDTLSLPMKFNLFFTINNLINQELTDISLVKVFITIFPSDKIMEVIHRYVKGLYIKHIDKLDYEDPEFSETFEDLELSNEFYLELIRAFKTDNEIYDDEYFKLASQMYLFLTVLGEKYSIPEAQRIIKFDKKECIIVPEEPDPSQANVGTLGKILNWRNAIKITQFMGIEINQHKEKRKKKKIKHHINNLIVSAKFFNKIIHSCEFMIDSSNDEAEELNIKKIYFIIDPRVYLISKNNIEAFFDEVDRSSSTTKLKSLIDILSFFVSDVNYKYSNLKKSKYLKSLMEVDYKNVDFMNFCISLAINFILLVFLKGDVLEQGEIYFTTVSLAGFQISLNVFYLIIFLISKYKFYVLVQKNNYEGRSIGIIDWFKIHLFESFLFNDEIYLMILNIIIGSVGILSKYGTFLFSLQLLTVIKFVPTIKEIVIAFKLRFYQLLSMIGFLAILIYFYSNIGFYFLSNEFMKELENGEKENLCATLLGCSITYFNLGVRSGGGIGDLLGMKPFDTSIYWVRYVTDMVFYITVILLLLNMINGVIVSTFSQIREESNEKEEDINNKCFICNIDRVEFEKRKIAFADHLKFEHNTKTYIRFLIYLKLISEKDLDADQNFIIDCVKERDISCFPVLRSLSVGNLEQKDKADEGDDD